MFLAYAVVAWPLGSAAGFVNPSGGLPAPGTLLLLALRTLLLPALLEETIFRAALNPHPSEGASRRRIVLAGSASLLIYLAMHPLAAVIFPQVSDPFLTPAFLFLVLLLGLAALFLYRRSGSVWPPVVLHWLVVLGWLSLGGEGVLPAGG